MIKFKLFLKQIRINHWIKNLIVFFPLFFGTSLFNRPLFIDTLIVFFIFSFSSSCIYILNDLSDIEEDKRHKVKKNRPLASGKVSKNEVYYLLILLGLLALSLLVFLNNISLFLVVGVFIITNLAYTYVTKQIAVWDILTISSLYLFRLFAGAVITKIEVSGWLFITLFFGTLILIIGKRYSEYKTSKVRKVLDSYSPEILKTLLIIALTVTISSYTIYAITQGKNYIPAIITFIFIIFRYYYLLETTTDGERPEELLIKDPQMFFSILLFFTYSLFMIYVY